MSYNPEFRDRTQSLRRLDELQNEHATHPVHENVMEKLVELLIKHGANINHEVRLFGTPLDYATLTGTGQKNNIRFDLFYTLNFRLFLQNTSSSKKS